MSKLTGTYFNEQWHEDNAMDIARARELTAEARGKLATMTHEEFMADAERIIREADAILGLLAYIPRECLLDGSDCGHCGCPKAEEN